MDRTSRINLAVASLDTVAPKTRDRDDSAAQELTVAMQAYKQWSGRMFPTWSEVLEVVRGLGYQKQS